MANELKERECIRCGRKFYSAHDHSYCSDNCEAANAHNDDTDDYAEGYTHDSRD